MLSGLGDKRFLPAKVAYYLAGFSDEINLTVARTYTGRKYNYGIVADQSSVESLDSPTRLTTELVDGQKNVLQWFDRH